MKAKQLFIIAAIAIPMVACSKKENTPSTIIAQDSISIRWDTSSEAKIALEGVYARVITLEGGSHLAVYEDFTGRSVASHTNDPEGRLWGNVSVMFDSMGWTGKNGKVVMRACNPEVRQLKDGTILGACNYRPAEEGRGPYCIAVTRSTDGGYTWRKPQIIFEAGIYSQEGCWEPSFLELPDGTVQIYFANEAPYPITSEQEISMLSSNDKGLTWAKDPVTVCFRSGHRDGMPVPAIIGDYIVIAIEDNARGQLQPYTVRTRISDNWSTPVYGNSSFREFCLKEYVSPEIYMGAPYLIVLPGGRTLLSYQTTEGRDNAWERSCMEVAIGDESGRNFVSAGRPFMVPKYCEGKWNSLALWDEHTVVAVSSTNKDGVAVAPWIIKGYIE